MTIVCGTDFSSPSEDAVLVASLIGARGSEEVELAHVIDDMGATIDEAGLAMQPARARLHRDAERGRLLGARIREQLVPGDPPQTLAALARSCGSELVIVAFHGRVEPTRFLPGSVAERTVLRSSTPVLIVRGSAAFDAWLRGGQPLRVVLGFDFGASSQAALRWIKQRLRSLGPCDLIVAHFARPAEARQRLGLGPGSDWSLEAPLAALLERELCEAVGDVPGPGRLELVVRAATRAIHEDLTLFAEQTQTDLLVVGTHRRSGISWLWEGSVSRAVIHAASMSVACIPASFHADEPSFAPSFRTVLAPTDGSPLGHHAIPFAYALVASGGTVHVLHVLDSMAESSRVETIERELGGLAPSSAAEHGIQTHVHVIRAEHDDASEISAAAERLAVDAICMSSRGRSGATAALLGSVARGVLARTRRPVLIVRGPAP